MLKASQGRHSYLVRHYPGDTYFGVTIVQSFKECNHCDGMKSLASEADAKQKEVEKGVVFSVL